MTASFQCVLDASTAVKIFLPEALQAEAFTLIGCMTDPNTHFHVPDLFFVECANIFWKQVQRGNATPQQVKTDLATLSTWRLQTITLFTLMSDALNLALSHNISAYDGCYAALAQQLNVPLITADQELVQKMAGSPVTAIWLGNWTPPPATP
jgi:predicted nucleic acid-binding protein